MQKSLHDLSHAMQQPVWHDGQSHDWSTEHAPPTASVDYAIIGGGFSGLWTAYYLSLVQPQAVIGLFESRRVGFGASGRNGGWCSGFFPLTLDEMAEKVGRDAALDAYRESFRTLDEIEKVLKTESISCGWHRGGTVQSASTLLQANRLEQMVAAQHAHGLEPTDLTWIPKERVSDHLTLAETHGAVFSPHCATINPFALVLGLARVLRQRGICLWEDSQVWCVNKGIVHHSRGEVRAKMIIQATEGYSHALRNTRRRLAPLYSLMVATEPLDAPALSKIGWRNRATFNDGGRMIIYAQLTSDNRIAFGGRGAPYHFASRTKDRFDIDDDTHRLICASIARHFPAAADARITHRWGGPLGVSRDWMPSVVVDRAAGYSRIGGYAGDGVAATNLFARILVDRLVGHDSVAARLPFFGHQSRRWEVEPLRFIGINSLLRLSDSIDDYERRRGKPPRIRSRIFESLL